METSLRGISGQEAVRCLGPNCHGNAGVVAPEGESYYVLVVAIDQDVWIGAGHNPSGSRNSSEIVSELELIYS